MNKITRMLNMMENDNVGEQTKKRIVKQIAELRESRNECEKRIDSLIQWSVECSRNIKSCNKCPFERFCGDFAPKPCQKNAVTFLEAYEIVKKYYNADF